LVTVIFNLVSLQFSEMELQRKAASARHIRVAYPPQSSVERLWRDQKEAFHGLFFIINLLYNFTNFTNFI